MDVNHLKANRYAYGLKAPHADSCYIGAGILEKPTLEGAYTNRISRVHVAIFALRGEAAFTDWLGVKHRVKPGSVILIPAGKRHSVAQKPDGNWLEFYVVLHRRVMEALSDLGLVNLDIPLLDFPLEKNFLDRLMNVLENVLTQKRNAVNRAFVAAQQILIDLYTSSGQPAENDRYNQLIERVSELLRQASLSASQITSLARDEGISYERFRKLFRERVGEAPKQYSIRYRIEQARLMLAHENSSIKDIAYRLGYADPFVFSKQFKKHVGSSPLAYQRLRRRL